MQWFGIDLPLSCSVHRMELVCLCYTFVRVKGFDCYPIARDFWVSKLENFGIFLLVTHLGTLIKGLVFDRITC